MNIMEKLGFNRKGTDKQDKSNPFSFSDKNPRTEGESRIYNLIILDESGSMQSIRTQALTGVNETIQTIRTAQEESPDDHQMLCFVTFDQGGNRPDVRVIIDNEKIENVKDITVDQYTPHGCTPLYDAMGLSFTALQKLVRDGDHVLVTVVTDGFENASHIYSASMIKELVEGLTAKGWVFTYIGANQDSEQTAGRLGISCTMDFEANINGSTIMWGKMRSSSREYYKKVRLSKLTGNPMNLSEDFFAENSTAKRISPDRISHLAQDEIFVFGSNLAGHHDGGAARIACERFGAVYGQGVGLQGQSYAIPTMFQTVDEIAPYVYEFIRFADAHPELKFMVTRIGCGIAGFTDVEIAPLFAMAYSLPNVYLPESFWKILTYKYRQ